MRNLTVRYQIYILLLNVLYYFIIYGIEIVFFFNFATKYNQVSIAETVLGQFTYLAIILAQMKFFPKNLNNFY